MRYHLAGSVRSQAGLSCDAAAVYRFHPRERESERETEKERDES